MEGMTRLLVPRVSLTKDPPPTSPVFFNPAASLNRDVSVAMASALGTKTFCDSMAGVGARGLRLANEVEKVERVSLVDFNSAAMKLGRKAASLNHVVRKCEFAVSETSSYLYSRFGRDARFAGVDVDPFGSPVRQIPGALCATADGGVLSITATDSAVLCGLYPKVSVRRYGGMPLNNHFRHETAIRVLAGSVARSAGANDIGVEPIASHSTRHYLRLYFRVRAGASKADESLGKLGYLLWCPACGHTSTALGAVPVCASCGKKAKFAGPLWTGPLTDSMVLGAARKAAVGRGLMNAADIFGGLEGFDNYPPWSYSIEGICSALGMATVPESSVYRSLREAGFSAMRTPFEKTGLKTVASQEEVVSAVKDSVGRKDEAETALPRARAAP